MFSHVKEIECFSKQDSSVEVVNATDEPILDPNYLMNCATSKVDEALQRLDLIFGVEWHDFEVFLRTVDSELDLTIDELWRRIDCTGGAEGL